MTKILIAIFLGGGTGSVLRYCAQMALHERIVPYSFPWATFAVNIIGSFLIGLFYALSARFNLSTEVRMLLTTGLCGGFLMGFQGAIKRSGRPHTALQPARRQLSGRLHHLFHILQRRIDADKTRILRVIRPIYLIKYFIGIFCGIRRKYLRKDLLKWQP